MAYTEAQKRATIKYQKENLVCLSIRMRPEEKAVIMAAADSQNVSVKNYLLRLVEMDRQCLVGRD